MDPIQYRIFRDIVYSESSRLIGKGILVSKEDYSSLMSLFLSTKKWRYDELDETPNIDLTWKDICSGQFISKANARKSLVRLEKMRFIKEGNSGVYRLNSGTVTLIVNSAIRTVEWKELIKDSILEHEKQRKEDLEFLYLLKDEEQGKKQQEVYIKEAEKYEDIVEHNKDIEYNESRSDREAKIRKAIGFDTRGVPLRLVLMAFKIMDDIEKEKNVFKIGGKILQGDNTNITFRINRSWRLLCKKIDSSIIPMRILPRETLNKNINKWRV